MDKNKQEVNDGIVHLTDETFDSEVIKSTLPVLVDFWAPWCGPCVALAPTLQKVAKRYEGKVKVAKLDVDEFQKTAQKFAIQSIPTLMIFEKGKVLGMAIGAASQSKIESLVERATLTA